MKIFNFCFLVLAFASSLLTGCVVESHSVTVSQPTNQNGEKSNIVNGTDKVSGEYTGEFLALGIGQSESLINSIKDGNNDTINTVLQNPNDFIPPVLFALADQLMDIGESRPAMFWYYTAQLRARSDANKSLDPTVSDGLTNLNRYYGVKIGQYAKSHIAELTEIMGKVIEYDRISDRRYNAKWVAVLGEDAYTKSKIAFIDESEYKSIDNNTRIGFYRGFKKAISSQ